jgi:hypothetical protein
MISPFRYRPTDPSADTDHDGEIADWEDNGLSNALAWASVTFVPTWCQNEEHWTSRVAAYVWTSCPCCAFFRGITIGIALSVPLWLLILLLLYLALRG